jgi:hypothetical protein
MENLIFRIFNWDFFEIGIELQDEILKERKEFLKRRRKEKEENGNNNIN